MFYNALLDQLHRGCEDHQVFLRSFNLPKCIVAGLSMVEGLFYSESGFNPYTGQKTLTDIFGAGVLLDELSCFRNIHCLLHVFKLVK